jgi:hypothetical protein
MKTYGEVNVPPFLTSVLDGAKVIRIALPVTLKVVPAISLWGEKLLVHRFVCKARTHD